MKTLCRLGLFMSLMAMPSALYADEQPTADYGTIPNAREIEPGLLTGGRPSNEDLERLKNAGYKSVINLEGLTPIASQKLRLPMNLVSSTLPFR
ncbi:hypothetical protein [Kordiimonas gwangyangensis]|uniref:hypothetical protein n=1 Tax=Kordiimonas gwangyangensis TaxID=288022 RepID=UPI0012DBE85C|nr:hypothetical protein [Kordiimonas gwangyangensis]